MERSGIEESPLQYTLGNFAAAGRSFDAAFGLAQDDISNDTVGIIHPVSLTNFHIRRQANISHLPKGSEGIGAPVGHLPKAKAT